MNAIALVCGLAAAAWAAAKIWTVLLDGVLYDPHLGSPGSDFNQAPYRLSGLSPERQSAWLAEEREWRRGAT